MRITDYIYLAKKDLLNFKLRSSLIIIVISIGIFTSTLNLYHTSKRQAELISSFKGMGSQIISVWIQDEGISLSDISFLSSYFPYISYEASDQKDIRYLRRVKKGVSITGITPGYKAVHCLAIKKGRFILPCEVREKRRVCLASSSLCNELKIRLGEKIRVLENNLRVIGIFKEEQGQEAILLPISTYNEIAKTTNSNRNLQVVILTTGDTQFLQKEIERMLKRRFPQDARQKARVDKFGIFYSEGLLGMLKEQRFASRLLILGIGLTTLLLAGVGIVSLIVLTIRQRYKEIGVMRAIGARRSNIFYLFLIEGILLSLAGLILGGGFSLIWLGLATGFRHDIFLQSFLLVSSICLPLSLCGYYPARKATEVSPCVAIREGYAQ
ncbi:MAG: ABC transporter permease [Candidatus Desantisbacteria bacterium]